MLRRLYVNNYRCFVNFTLELQQLNLLLGVNSTGKSSLLDLVDKIRRVASKGQDVGQLFPYASMTRWADLPRINVELSARAPDGDYEYALEVEPSAKIPAAKITHEKLSFDGHPLFEARDGEAQLYRDNYSEGPKFQGDWSRSGISVLQPRPDNTRLTWFRDWVDQFYVLSVCPHHMDDEASTEQTHFSPDAKDFVAWYRDVAQADPSAVLDAHSYLRAALPGFTQLRLEKEGASTRRLMVDFQMQDESNGKAKSSHTVSFALSDLSDGGRSLIVLYTLLAAAKGIAATTPVTLMLDEPTAYVSLAEVQPILSALQDLTAEYGCQVILTSHHPELLDKLAASNGIVLSRKGLGHVRVKEFERPPSDMTASEIISREWEDV